MNYTSICALAMLALLGPMAVHTETEADYAVPPPRAEQLARRAAIFAPGAAKTASRLPIQEREDRAFLKAAAANSRFEAEAARLVLAKSADPRVRALATDLIIWHNATRLEMRQLLHVRDMALPMMENEHRRVLKRLGRLAGRKLDREFLQQVGLKHQRHDLAYYELAAAKTGDPSLKAWVDRQLPTLRHQVASAERFALPERPSAGEPGANALPAEVQALSMVRAPVSRQSMVAGPAAVRRNGRVNGSGSR